MNPKPDFFRIMVCANLMPARRTGEADVEVPARQSSYDNAPLLAPAAWTPNRERSTQHTSTTSGISAEAAERLHVCSVRGYPDKRGR